MTMKGDGIPELLNARDVAQILRISERSVWRLCAERKLPAPLHVGGAARWPKSEIEDWFKRAAQIRDESREVNPIKNEEK